MIIIIVINFLTPVLNSKGMKKLRHTIQKVQKSSCNKPYSSSSFKKQSCSKMALYCWIWTVSRWNKKLISLSSSDWSASLRPSFDFRKEDATRRIDWAQWLNGNWLKSVMSLDVWIFRRLTSGCLFCCWTSFTGSCCNVWVGHGQRTDDCYVPSQRLRYDTIRDAILTCARKPT